MARPRDAPKMARLMEAQMARRTKLVLAAIGLGAVAVALVPLAFATSIAPTGRVSAAPLNPVDSSGVR